MTDVQPPKPQRGDLNQILDFATNPFSAALSGLWIAKIIEVVSTNLSQGVALGWHSVAPWKLRSLSDQLAITFRCRIESLKRKQLRFFVHQLAISFALEPVLKYELQTANCGLGS